jgi:hypothetical protein
VAKMGVESWSLERSAFGPSFGVPCETKATGSGRFPFYT